MSIRYIQTIYSSCIISLINPYDISVVAKGAIKIDRFPKSLNIAGKSITAVCCFAYTLYTIK